MFSEQTVFVLGAGASWHYGFPTGEKLVSDVIKEAIILRDHYGQPFTLMNGHTRSKGESIGGESYRPLIEAARSDCQELIRRLIAVKPLVIDYFLAQNPKLQAVGRFAIALAIMKAEAEWLRCQANMNRHFDQQNSPYKRDRAEGVEITKFKDDWLRFILSHMISGCDSFEDLRSRNHVNFVTFNYDTSLERRISDCLRSIEIFEDSPIESFFSDARVVHVYGKTGEHTDPPLKVVSPPTRGVVDQLTEYTDMLDAAYRASKGIRTISDQKDGDGNDIRVAKDLLLNAKHVYLLGYGFDPINSERLGLDKCFRSSQGRRPTIYLTNYGDSKRIRDRASRLIVGQPGQLFPGSINEGVCSISTRDVYSAFELDFELAE